MPKDTNFSSFGITSRSSLSDTPTLTGAEEFGGVFGSGEKGVSRISGSECREEASRYRVSAPALGAGGRALSVINFPLSGDEAVFSPGKVLFSCGKLVFNPG